MALGGNFRGSVPTSVNLNNSQDYYVVPILTMSFGGPFSEATKFSRFLAYTPHCLPGCAWFSFGVETTRIIHGVATFQSSGSVVLDSSKTFSEDHIYIGNGHFSHRWQCTEWQNPFIAGRNCSVVIKYSQWIGDCALHHKVLVWDCPSHQLCQVMPSLQLPGNLLR